MIESDYVKWMHEESSKDVSIVKIQLGSKLVEIFPSAEWILTAMHMLKKLNGGVNSWKLFQTHFFGAYYKSPINYYTLRLRDFLQGGFHCLL